MSTTPTRVSEPGGGPAAVGKSVIVKGQIFSREDLFVDGEVEGTIEVQEHRLTVGPNGKVQANVKAREIVAQGTIHGNMEAADKIEIRKEAKMVGDLRTARIMIEDGAYFKGSVDIIKPEVKPAPPRPAVPPPPPPPPATGPSRMSAAAVDPKA